MDLTLPESLAISSNYWLLPKDIDFVEVFISSVGPVFFYWLPATRYIGFDRLASTTSVNPAVSELVCTPSKETCGKVDSIR